MDMQGGTALRALRGGKQTTIGLSLGVVALLVSMLAWALAPLRVATAEPVAMLCTMAGMQGVDADGNPLPPEKGKLAGVLCPLCPLLAALDGPPPAPSLPRPPLVAFYLRHVVTADQVPASGPRAGLPQARAPPFFA